MKLDKQTISLGKTQHKTNRKLSITPRENAHNRLNSSGFDQSLEIYPSNEIFEPSAEIKKDETNRLIMQRKSVCKNTNSLNFCNKDMVIQNHGLKQRNLLLIQKLDAAESKLQEFMPMKEELQFRKEQQIHMNQLLDYYIDLCNKLRSQMSEQQIIIENQKTELRKFEEQKGLKEKERSKGGIHGSLILNQSHSRSLSITTEDSKRQSRKSLGDSQKQNHPLTPKTRVNVSVQGFLLDHQIKMRKKSFV